MLLDTYTEIEITKSSKESHVPKLSETNDT